MAAKSYVLGFARRPLTAYGADWRLACLTCETLPTLENGGAERETTPDGKQGIRVTFRLREGLRWGDGTPVSAEDLRFAWEAGREAATGFGPPNSTAAPTNSSWWTRAPSPSASTA